MWFHVIPIWPITLNWQINWEPITFTIASWFPAAPWRWKAFSTFKRASICQNDIVLSKYFLFKSEILGLVVK